MKRLSIAALCILPLLACASSENEKMQIARLSPAEKMVQRGDESLQKGNLRDAKYRYAVSLRLMQKTDDLKGMAGLYLKYSNLSLLEGDLENARRFFDSGKVIVEKENYSNLKAETAIAEVSLLISEGKGDAAMKAAQAALQKAPTGDKGKLANALGIAALAQNDLTAAKGHFEQALSVGITAKDASLESVARVNLAQLLLKSGDYDGAITHLQRSLELEKQAAATVSIGDTLHLVGMAYEGKKDMQNAAYFYRRALQVNLQGDMPKKVEADKDAISRVETSPKPAVAEPK